MKITVTVACAVWLAIALWAMRGALALNGLWNAVFGR